MSLPTAAPNVSRVKVSFTSEAAQIVDADFSCRNKASVSLRGRRLRLLDVDKASLELLRLRIWVERVERTMTSSPLLMPSFADSFTGISIEG